LGKVHQFSDIFLLSRYISSEALNVKLHQFSDNFHEFIHTKRRRRGEKGGVKLHQFHIIFQTDLLHYISSQIFLGKVHQFSDIILLSRYISSEALNVKLHQFSDNFGVTSVLI